MRATGVFRAHGDQRYHKYGSRLDGWRRPRGDDHSALVREGEYLYVDLGTHNSMLTYTYPTGVSTLTSLPTIRLILGALASRLQILIAARAMRPRAAPREAASALAPQR